MTTGSVCKLVHDSQALPRGACKSLAETPVGLLDFRAVSSVVPIEADKGETPLKTYLVGLLGGLTICFAAWRQATTESSGGK